MKYISFDLETTSDNAKTGSILSFGAVIEDTDNIVPIEELPRFHVYIKNEEPIKGNHFALQMNQDILYKIATGKTDVPIISPEHLEEEFSYFLYKNGVGMSMDGHITINVAGKNVATFDMRFIEKLNWKRIYLRHRVIDPALLYLDLKEDEKLPDLKICKQRAGLEEDVAHDALEDAIDVVKLLRAKYDVLGL